MRTLIREGSLGKHNFCLAALALAAVLGGCSPASRTITIAGDSRDANALMAAHPAEPGRNLTPILLEKSEHTSVHLVWVRDREQPHRHAAHDLTVVLLHGQGTMRVGDREVPMLAGDVAVIPAGTTHWFTNGGDTPSAALAVYAPPSDGSDLVPVTP